MLLGEYYQQRAIEDSRTYKLLCCWVKDPPPPGELFPSLNRTPVDDEDESDDVMKFQQVTATLTPYRS